MSEHIFAWIRIGGHVARDKVDLLLAAVERSEVDAEWGEPAFVPRSADALLGAQDEDNGWLWLCDERSECGRFPALERACRQLGLSYTLGSDVTSEDDAEVVDWRPGMKRPIRQTASVNNNVDRLVNQAPVRKALKALEAGRVDQAKTILRQCCPDIPPLPPFKIV